MSFRLSRHTSFLYDVFTVLLGFRFLLHGLSKLLVGTYPTAPQINKDSNVFVS